MLDLSWFVFIDRFWSLLLSGVLSQLSRYTPRSAALCSPEAYENLRQYLLLSLIGKCICLPGDLLIDWNAQSYVHSVSTSYVMFFHVQEKGKWSKATKNFFPLAEQCLLKNWILIIEYPLEQNKLFWCSELGNYSSCKRIVNCTRLLVMNMYCALVSVRQSMKSSSFLMVMLHPLLKQ